MRIFFIGAILAAIGGIGTSLYFVIKHEITVKAPPSIVIVERQPAPEDNRQKQIDGIGKYKDYKHPGF